ncbi:MAG: hypothetical protein VX800_01960 [Chloroflexota bacterium]|nr:hypothetical protein [Chloroflexota bacterium]
MPERYQKEIEDLLGKLDKPPIPQPQARQRSLVRQVALHARAALSGGGSWFSPGKVLAVSLALFLVGALLNATFPGIIVPILVWTGLITFIVGYAFFFINTSEPYERRWRGQVIEKPETKWAKFQSRFKRVKSD